MGKTAWIPHAATGLKPQRGGENDPFLKDNYHAKRVGEAPVDTRSHNACSKPALKRMFSDFFDNRNGQDIHRLSGSEACGAMPVVVMAALLAILLIVCAIIY